MMKQWLVATLGAAALLVSAGASAQSGTTGGFYVGAEVGNADVGPEDDTAIKILGGYQFHPNVAVEAVALGTFPVANQVSLLGKIGFAHLDADPGDRDTEITWGLGVQYDVNRNLGLRAQWQRYETDPDEVTLLSVGLVYRF
jgi:OOP family OmpA-OmpF porin